MQPYPSASISPGGAYEAYLQSRANFLSGLDQPNAPAAQIADPEPTTADSAVPNAPLRITGSTPYPQVSGSDAYQAYLNSRANFLSGLQQGGTELQPVAAAKGMTTAEQEAAEAERIRVARLTNPTYGMSSQEAQQEMQRQQRAKEQDLVTWKAGEWLKEVKAQGGTAAEALAPGSMGTGGAVQVPDFVKEAVAGSDAAGGAIGDANRFYRGLGSLAAEDKYGQDAANTGEALKGVQGLFGRYQGYTPGRIAAQEGYGGTANRLLGENALLDAFKDYHLKGAGDPGPPGPAATPGALPSFFGSPNFAKNFSAEAIAKAVISGFPLGGIFSTVTDYADSDEARDLVHAQMKTGELPPDTLLQLALNNMGSGEGDTSMIGDATTGSEGDAGWGAVGGLGGIY